MDTKKRPDHKQISLRMTATEYDYLNSMAAKYGMTVSKLVRSAIKSRLINIDVKDVIRNQNNRYKK